MNLYLRVLWVLISSLWKPRIAVSSLVSELEGRVFPNDVDLNFHMNNGRYLAICDLNRVDLFVRTGLLGLMLRRRWSPIIVSHTMNYKKALRPFDKYRVHMVIESWDATHFHAKHTFSARGRVVAFGESVAVIRSRHGIVPPSQVVAAVEAKARGESALTEGARRAA